MAVPIGGMELPLLGELTRQQLKDTILNALIDEAGAVDFYGRLEKQAPDALHREFIGHAYEDEVKHIAFFERLYFQLFGRGPRYGFEPVEYDDYRDGILKALKGELAAAEFYRDIQLSVNDQLTRDTFYLAMTDELEHAARFSVLYGTL